MPLPATIIFNLAGNQPVRESTRHMFAAPICQAGVMPGDAKGENTAKAGTIKLHGFPCARRRMIRPPESAIVADISLKCRRRFADIMQPSRCNPKP